MVFDFAMHACVLIAIEMVSFTVSKILPARGFNFFPIKNLLLLCQRPSNKCVKPNMQIFSVTHHDDVALGSQDGAQHGGVHEGPR